MISSLVMIEGDVKKEALSISLTSAKQIVLGRLPVSGEWVLHIAAMSLDFLGKALIKFAKVPNVTGVTTLLIRSKE